jgi:steroid delta-isomerase
MIDPGTIQTAIAAYFAATRAMDVEAYLRAFADDAINHDPVGGTPLEGKAALRQFFCSIVDQFATIGLTEEFVHIVGSEVAVKWIGRGISKNGREVVFEGIDLFDMNEAGQIQTLRAYWDPAALMAQLQE